MRPALDLPTLLSEMSGRGLSVPDVVPEPVLLAQCDSTNTVVRERGRLGELVVTEHQVAGRGRLGRVWEDVPHAGLAMSVLVPLPPVPGWVPLVAGLALHRTVAELTSLASVLKWPNDVLVPADTTADGTARKLAGVLCELVAGGIVVGIGVNVDHERGELPVDTATSLRTALAGGAPVPAREAVAAAWLAHLLALVADLDDRVAAADVLAEYRGACATIGQRVRLHLPDGSTPEALATGIDPSGALRVERDGTSATVSAGDVIHIRPAR